MISVNLVPRKNLSGYSRRVDPNLKIQQVFYVTFNRKILGESLSCVYVRDLKVN